MIQFRHFRIFAVVAEAPLAGRSLRALFSFLTKHKTHNTILLFWVISPILESHNIHSLLTPVSKSQKQYKSFLFCFQVFKFSSVFCFLFSVFIQRLLLHSVVTFSLSVVAVVRSFVRSSTLPSLPFRCDKKPTANTTATTNSVFACLLACLLARLPSFRCCWLLRPFACPFVAHPLRPVIDHLLLQRC